MAKPEAPATPRTATDVEAAIRQQIKALAELRGGVCYPLLLTSANIGMTLVEDVYDELRRDCAAGNSQLDVVLHSGGGDIDAAYNLALLLRRFGTERLTFIVPRWAKSAATLLVCAGDSILMTPVAELGPVDPQITEMNPLERRLESFSPLHIESTLALIREEYKKGDKRMADKLIERLQFPLTLGSFKKSLDIGRQYLIKLLSTRMLKGSPEKAADVAKQLTEGYADHGYCIDVEEARAIGLRAEELPAEQLDVVWKIHRLARQKRELERARKDKELRKRIKEIPPELLDRLPPELLGYPEQGTAGT